MKVVVLGAGIAGITTAWYLAAGGAEVTVVERAAEPAAETSHANGGHLSTQSGVPWPSAAGLRDCLLSRFTRARPIRVRWGHDPGRCGWLARASASVRPGVYRRAADTGRRLARLSREAFEALCAELELDVCLERRGVIAIYRGKRAFARARKKRLPGVEAIPPQEVLAREPALAESTLRFAGALYYPDDATGDCRRFCLQLARHAEARGVRFRYGETALHVSLKNGACSGVETDRDHHAADACVVALGVHSAPFLRPLVKLPLLALRGYTLTAPVDDRSPAPGRFSDQEGHLVFSRLGTRLRVAGMADFTGLEETPNWGRGAHLERIARQWYPALRHAGVEHWSCLRSMTPDGPPILGAGGVPGMWLNVGLGPLGWTLGCGAGRIVADLVLGNTPSISLDGLTRERFAGLA